MPIKDESFDEYYSFRSDGTHSFYVDCEEGSDDEPEHDIRTPQDTSIDAGNDNDGHLNYQLGDVLSGKLKILDNLGEGGYSKVVKALDLTRRKKFALKIIKKFANHESAAQHEIKVLKEIAKLDPKKKSLCIPAYNWFRYHDHYCLSFDLLGCSIYDFMNSNERQPFPIDQIRHIAYQLCYAVNFLHQNKITHTDLKPDNIMFVKSDYDIEINKKGSKVRRIRDTNIRLIDFGCVTFNDDPHRRIVTTQPYRAPEVILELGWSQPCDAWGIGCILFELYKGHILFQTYKNSENLVEHLAMMDIILGNIPRSMARKSETSYFHNGGIDWDENSSAGQYVRETCKPLGQYATELDNSDHQKLFDLMYHLLEYIPEERIVLSKALEHRFFDLLPTYKKLQ